MFVQLLLLVHILSSTLLFGTGLGTAFHGWMAQRSRDLRAITVVNRQVVWADWLFTAPAVIVQPVTGFWLAHLEGVPLTTGWLALAIALYILVGACWLPVVWLQIRMHRMARAALSSGRSVACAVRDLRPLVVLSWMAGVSRSYRDFLPHGPEAVLRLKPDRGLAARHRIRIQPK